MSGTPIIAPPSTGPSAFGVPGKVTAAAPLPTPTTATCANCFAPRTGHFCAQCGAPSRDERPLTVHRFASDLWLEVTSIDSATYRTFRSLFLRPGELTRAYLDGRTRWFLSPVRVYLIAFAAMVFAMGLMPGLETAQRAAMQQKLDQQWSQQKQQMSVLKSGDNRRAVGTAATTNMMRTQQNPWFSLPNALFVGVALALLYRGRRRNYAEHVVFALHLLAFNAFLSIVTLSLRLATNQFTSFSWIAVLHWTTLGIYFLLASLAVFGESRRRTAAKSVAFVALAQVAVLIIPLTVAMGTTILTVIQLKQH